MSDSPKHENEAGAIPAGPINDATEMIFVAGRAFVESSRHEQVTGALAAERDRAIETRENANACTRRVEAQRDALRVELDHADVALDRSEARRKRQTEVTRAALAERDRLLERERHFAKALGVTDGGQYRNDWDAAIARVLTEADAARADVDALLEAIAAVETLHEVPWLIQVRETANEIAAKRDPSRTSSPSRTL